MLHSIDKKKIYLYFILMMLLLSIHNTNLKKTSESFFNIKEIKLNTKINEKIRQDIFNSLSEFQNTSIFSKNLQEIKNKLNNFNIIGEYKVQKKFPSSIDIEIKNTKILAYYYENNIKTYLGENGKKIIQDISIKKNLPLIIGIVDTDKFLYLNKRIIANGFNLNDFPKIYFFKSNRWDLLYKNTLLIRLPMSDLDKSLSQVRKIIEKSNLNNIKIIDLRLDNKIIFYEKN